MRLFTSKDSFYNKLNLVDENDVFVGYDYSQDCCEHFGYRWETSCRTHLQEPDLNGAVFTKRHKKLESTDDYYDDCECEYGFEIKLNNGNLIWFVIYNYHNGYYGHGFDFTDKEEKITSGVL